MVRSTFSAETNGLIDALEKVFPIQTAYHQLLCGSEETAAQLAELQDAGNMVPGIEAGVDARGVYESIHAPDLGDLQESFLKLHIISIREKLEAGSIRRPWWLDTRDMLADGLTKGGIRRDAPVAACEGGTWKVTCESISCTRRRAKL